MIDYVKISLLGGLCLILFGSGYWMGYSRYIEYKKSVEIISKTQEAKVESITKQHELVTKGIEKEYEAKLALLRTYYANGVRQPNTSKLPNFSNTTPSIDDFTPNGLLIKCAETTQQLVSLQDWLNSQMGIK